MKEFAESNHDSKIRDLTEMSRALSLGPPIFKFFLDGSRRVYKVDDIQYDKKVYPVICGQISVSCCRRENNDDNSFKRFSQVYGEAYPVVCIPVSANGEGIDNDVFFRSLCDKINNIPFVNNFGIKFGKALYYGTKLKGLKSDQIDAITANIINERNPVCYGNDARWANHLYPVYMTECFCKSKFRSDISFLS